MIEMYMPALSSTMEEGTIVQWLKEVGDKIEVGPAIACGATRCTGAWGSLEDQYN